LWASQSQAFSESVSARVGIDYPILPRIRLDVSADHRAPDLSGLAEAEAETVTFAAVVRVRL
jgi:hypothetical protein